MQGATQGSTRLSQEAEGAREMWARGWNLVSAGGKVGGVAGKAGVRKME